MCAKGGRSIRDLSPKPQNLHAARITLQDNFRVGISCTTCLRKADAGRRGSRFRVWDSGVRAWGLLLFSFGFRVCGVGRKVCGSEVRSESAVVVWP